MAEKDQDSDFEAFDADIIDNDDADLLDADELDEFGDEDAPVNEPVPPPAKKKKSFFTIGIIVLAVLMGGLILFYQLVPETPPAGAPAPETASAALAPSDASQMTALQQAGEDAATPEQPLAPPSDPQPSPAAQGFMNDPSSLAASDGTVPALPEEPSMTGPGDLPPADLPVPGAVSPAPAPSVAPAAPPAETPVLPTIDQIRKADATPPVPAAAQPAAAIGQPAPAVPAELEEARARIASLERDLAAAAAQLKEAESRKDDEIAALKREMETRRVESRASETAAVAENPRPAPKARPRAKARPKASPAKASWELRSAQPGMAMVSRAGQSELKTVRVGDSIAGIGQVTAISQGSAGWVVEGTAGRISQ